MSQNPLTEAVVQDPLVIDCAQCVVRETNACDDCLVTYICNREPDDAVIITMDELRSMRALSDVGLVPSLKHTVPDNAALDNAAPDNTAVHNEARQYEPGQPTCEHGGVVSPSLEHLRAVATRHGIDALGVARAEVFVSTRDDLKSRKAVGLSADMQFTYRNPDRATDPTRALPDARSLVVGARSYHREPGANDVKGPAGDVAKYVWEDHYAQLRVGLEAVAAELTADGWRTRVLMDDNALVDREAAYRAGLGWYGKNANLLLPGQGSWFVLGSILTDAELPPAEPIDDGCGTCDQCLTSCPTEAIVAPGVIDARRCLAWLVQAQGIFPAEHRAALGTRIYGCDDCQDVCPANRRRARQPVHITNAARRPWVPLLDLLGADDETLLADYGAWYIPAREPRYLRRNALVAIANTRSGGDPSVRAAVAIYLGHPDPMLRVHAVWAARRLDIPIPSSIHHDPDADVQAELARDVPSSL